VVNQLQAPAALTPQKEPPVTTERDEGWSGPFGDEKNLLPLHGIEPVMVKPAGQIYVWLEFS